MNDQLKIPDAETRARNIARWREVCLQLDELALKLDELIAMVEADLRRQRWERLQKRSKNLPKTESSNQSV